MKLSLFYIFLFCLTFSAFTQTEKIKWNHSSYNFGTVNEKGNAASHRFYFINKGDSSIKIKNVIASCGCTTSSWSKNDISSFEIGYVDVTFTPHNRPGKFSKYITLSLENSTYSKICYINGFVQPLLTSPELMYTSKIGNLRFKNTNFDIGNIQRTDTITRIFNVFNDSQQPISLQLKNDSLQEIELTFEPKIIQPKQIGNIRVIYKTTKFTTLGMVEKTILLTTNDTLTPNIKIHIKANIREQFSDSIKQIPNRPILILSSYKQYLGKIEEGRKHKFEITVFNIGTTPLLIREINTSCECILLHSNIKKIEPGKSKNITIVFDSTGKSSYVQNTITIVSNDPKNPIQTYIAKHKVIPKTNN